MPKSLRSELIFELPEEAREVAQFRREITLGEAQEIANGMAHLSVVQAPPTPQHPANDNPAVSVIFARPVSIVLPPDGDWRTVDEWHGITPGRPPKRLINKRVRFWYRFCPKSPK